MTIDPLWIWIALGAVAVLVIVGLFSRGVRRSRTDALREKFGSEYDHAVNTVGSRSRAESELQARAEEAKNFNIRPLTATENQRFRADWNRLEMRFLERPTTAVVEADELIADIMRTRGYPIGDFERHAASLSVSHPGVVEHFRAGHAAIDANRDGQSSTEELRQAMLHYRALIDDLLVKTDDVVSNVPIVHEVRSDPRTTASASPSPVRTTPENSREDIVR